MSRASNPTKVQQWSDRLERFENSGQTVREFCVAEAVSQPSFYQWRKRLGVNHRARAGQSRRGGASSRARSPRRANEPAFRPVQLTPPPSFRPGATIRLADGVAIELGADPQVVGVVVRCVLEQVLPAAAARAGGASC